MHHSFLFNNHLKILKSKIAEMQIASVQVSSLNDAFVVGNVAMGNQPVVVGRWTSLPKYSKCTTSYNRLYVSQSHCFQQFNHRN